MRQIRIIHSASNIVLAEGPLGWGITQFEGNFYVQEKYLKTKALKINFIPGLCIYKFLYVWLDLIIDGKPIEKNIAWKYWLPTPLLPFIWFRVAFSGYDEKLTIEYFI